MMGLSVEFGSVTTPSEAELTARASRRFSAFCVFGFELSPPLLVLPALGLEVGGALVPPVEV